MSDEDPFSYTPLRVSKRRKRMTEGRQKKKMRQGEEVDIKKEIKEGKTFKCEICSIPFAYQSQLIIHEKIS